MPRFDIVCLTISISRKKRSGIVLLSFSSGRSVWSRTDEKGFSCVDGFLFVPGKRYIMFLMAENRKPRGIDAVDWDSDARSPPTGR